MRPLVPVSDLETYLQRELEQARATMALAGASGLIRNYCRWPISQETATFTLDGSGTNVLSLPTMRLTAVHEVRVDGLVLDPSWYRWSRVGLIELVNAMIWPRRFRAVDVDCDHGYGYTELPDEIRAVVLGLATRWYVNPNNLKSRTVGAVSETYSTSGGTSDGGPFTDLEATLLGGYRLP